MTFRSHLGVLIAVASGVSACERQLPVVDADYGTSNASTASTSAGAGRGATPQPVQANGNCSAPFDYVVEPTADLPDIWDLRVDSEHLYINTGKQVFSIPRAGGSLTTLYQAGADLRDQIERLWVREQDLVVYKSPGFGYSMPKLGGELTRLPATSVRVSRYAAADSGESVVTSKDLKNYGNSDHDVEIALVDIASWTESKLATLQHVRSVEQPGLDNGIVFYASSPSLTVGGASQLATLNIADGALGTVELLPAADRRYSLFGVADGQLYLFGLPQAVDATTGFVVPIGYHIWRVPETGGTIEDLGDVDNFVDDDPRQFAISDAGVMLSVNSLIPTHLKVNRYWLAKGMNHVLLLPCMAVQREEAAMALDARDLYVAVSAGQGIFGVAHRVLP